MPAGEQCSKCQAKVADGEYFYQYPDLSLVCRPCNSHMDNNEDAYPYRVEDHVLSLARHEMIEKACESVLSSNDFYEMGLSNLQLVQIILAIAAVEIEHEPKKQ